LAGYANLNFVVHHSSVKRITEAVVDVVWNLKLVGIMEAYNVIPTSSSGEVIKKSQSNFLSSEDFSSSIESKPEIYWSII
jgi:hypothetical protein